jgi:hypothetical protein
MGKQRERVVPGFLQGVQVTAERRKLIESYNSNWNKLYQNLLAGDRDPVDIIQIIRVEFDRDYPREGMLGRLVGKYIYNQRRQMVEQIESTLEEMKSE